MDSKRDGTSITPLRTSDRLRRRPKYFGRPYLYYKPMIRKRIKSKRRTAASQIVKKLLRPRNRSIKMPSSNSIVTNLRRSTRKRKMSINLEDYDTDTSASEDDDLMAPRYRSSQNKTEHNVRNLSASLRREKIAITNSLPRREGLRPRRSVNGRRAQPYGRCTCSLPPLYGANCSRSCGHRRDRPDRKRRRPCRRVPPPWIGK